MPNTTWNPADKSATITLSGGNLVATGAAVNTGVRTIGSQTTGKFYWEITTTTFTNTVSSVGIATATRSLATNITTAVTGAAGVVRSGLVYIEGVAQGFSLGTVVSGNVVCFACDLTGQLLWIRRGAAGSWNGTGTPNPATGVGGMAFTSMGAGIGAYAHFYCSVTGEVVTANFGDSTFAGAVPSGFTAGFPGPVAGAGAQARAIVLA